MYDKIFILWQKNIYILKKLDFVRLILILIQIGDLEYLQIPLTLKKIICVSLSYFSDVDLAIAMAVAPRHQMVVCTDGLRLLVDETHTKIRRLLKNLTILARFLFIICTYLIILRVIWQFQQQMWISLFYIIKFRITVWKHPTSTRTRQQSSFIPIFHSIILI